MGTGSDRQECGRHLSAAGGDQHLSDAYDSYAERYTQLLLGRRATHLADTVGLVQALLDGAGPGRGHLVDLACGPGLVSAALVEAGWLVTGVDASAEMVRIAQQRLSRILHRDALDTGLPSGVDAVVSTYSHTDVASWPGLVAEAHRLLRPDGTLVYVGAHPAFVGPHVQRREHPRWPARVAAGYYHDRRLRHHAPGLSPGGLRQHVGVRHLSVQALVEPVLAPGWRVQEVREDAADPPTLLGFRAVKA